MMDGVESKSKYYRAHLKTAECQAVYDQVLHELLMRKQKVVVSNSALAKCAYPLESIVQFVHMDNPGLFYVDFHQYRLQNSGLHRNVIFNYLYPTDKINNIEIQLKRKIADAIATITQLTSYEKELALHDYLAISVKYEHKDKSNHRAHSAIGALLYGRAVCEGYSMAFKLLCEAARIHSIVVSGTGTNMEGTGNHAWNIVKLKDKCYHVDVTWDSCVTIEDVPSHGCFNITDKDIAQDHTWDKKLLPTCDSTEDNYFVRQNCYFTSRDALKQYFASCLKQGQKEFAIKINRRFEDHAEISKILNEALRPRILTSPFGYSYQVRYDKMRSVAQICIK
jgi:hypothetical protein